VVTTKKAMVVVLMAVLGSSVLVGAISYYNRTSTATPNAVENQSVLNARLNTIVDFCMNSLPKGVQACDNQLKGLVSQVCSANNGLLDACHNGKVNLYYEARSAQQSKSVSNKTH
jgi:hypothetical protein